ncbi:hypothetical protein PsYK624_170750 [Phanerochaete sordida]|uniref:Uncharacterized protein n=1 Tax=Phanerochaete sordida TaxID=48140 RepID=A0A9P3GS13_9APHY|nr:hypothetical protein PsYK624_170750 [Phanerochaete sordida]
MFSSTTRSRTPRPLPSARAVPAPHPGTRGPPRHLQRDETADGRRVRTDRLPDMTQGGLTRACPC